MSLTAGRQVSHTLDSVTVTVPNGQTCLQGQFGIYDNFHGFNLTTPKDVAAGAALIELQIKETEYETDQITVANAFAKGDLVNFDTGTGLLTTAAVAGAIVGPVGRVTVAKDSNNVIWMKLLGQRRG